LDAFRFKSALEQVMNGFRDCNKYVDARAPWKTRKTDMAVTGVTINMCIQAAKTLGILMTPFLPFAAEKLVHMVKNLCRYLRLTDEVERLREQIKQKHELEFIIGKNGSLLHLLDTVKTVAPTDSSVLIVGESGAGKELIANAVHLLSRREGKAFVKVHCAALPASLLESELFGHEKGAFTGAIRQVKGRFESADQGTILLDEVDEIPLEIQVKLLRVLQEQVVERLGNPNPIVLDVRVIAACKTDLLERVKKGEFREDLYYRISVVHLTVPPLRERLDDIPLLAHHFLSIYRKRMMKEITCFTEEALRALLNYEYPGNVRELEHIVESACALSQGGPIELRLLPEAVKSKYAKSPALNVGFQGMTLAQAMCEYERSYLAHALREFKGNKTQLAHSLGISRKHLWQKLKEHNLADDE
jgi:two-component system response regulator AtoC